jgi:putative membrane protein
MGVDYPHWLLVAFSLFWLALAIRPHNRVVWLTENALTIASLVAALATYPYWPISNLSYSLVFVFLVLHTIGAHYTYARVPYDAVARARSGLGLSELFGWTRNHYDRLVHLAYGLLTAYPAYELLERYAEPAGAWSYILSPALIMATSMAFEVAEWWAAELLGGGAGSDYVGAQGDAWDAQKDMALATGGAIVAMLVTALMG